MLFGWVPIMHASEPDTLKDQFWNYHFQLTVLPQYHPAFKAEYSGLNSL